MQINKLRNYFFPFMVNWSQIYIFSIGTGQRVARVDGSAKNVSDCQLSSSGSSEPIAYCAFLLTFLFLFFLGRF